MAAVRGRAAAALAAMLLVPGPAFAAEPEPEPGASCKAQLAGARALISVRIGGLFTPELLRLVRLGLTGRLTLSLAVRRRSFLFGATVGRAERELPLVWSAELEVFLLDGRPLDDPREVALSRIAVELRDPEGASEVEVEANLKVITADSLGRAAEFLAGSGAGGASVSRGLLGALASDLTRAVATSCPLRTLR